jgi:hypothetical protein
MFDRPERIAGLADLGLVGGSWGETGPPWVSSAVAAYDINESNVVGLSDLGIVGARWGEKPGPSGLACQQDCGGSGPYPPPPIGCLGGNPP